MDAVAAETHKTDWTKETLSIVVVGASGGLRLVVYQCRHYSSEVRHFLRHEGHWIDSKPAAWQALAKS